VIRTRRLTLGDRAVIEDAKERFELRWPAGRPIIGLFCVYWNKAVAVSERNGYRVRRTRQGVRCRRECCVSAAMRPDADEGSSVDPRTPPCTSLMSKR